jgi:hypothetical protein
MKQIQIIGNMFQKNTSVMYNQKTYLIYLSEFIMNLYLKYGDIF